MPPPLCIGLEIIDLSRSTVIDQHLVRVDIMHLLFLKVSNTFLAVYVAFGKLPQNGVHGLLILFPLWPDSRNSRFWPDSDHRYLFLIP